MTAESEIDTGKPGTRLLFEDDETRVWLLELEDGEATEWHPHEWDYIFVVDLPGKVKLEYRDGSGEIQDDYLGQVVYRERGPSHRLINMSGNFYRNVVIEFVGKKFDQWPPAPVQSLPGTAVPGGHTRYHQPNGEENS